MVDIVLKPHQLLPIDFLKNHRGLILYHSTGSGKTLTALFSVYQFNYEIIIIGSKSSKVTFADNIKKADLDQSRFTFYTYAKLKKILESNITLFKNASVIVDEAHTIRNENMYNLYIASALKIAKKVILLTATPVVNYLNDLSVLVNIVRGEDVLPTERGLFDQMFFDDENMQLINTNILADRIKNTISYYKILNNRDYPKSETHYVQVEMSHTQVEEYVYYLRKIIYEGVDTVDTINILNVDYGLLPNKKRNFFLNATRQLSNTVKDDPDSPKIREIFAKILDGPKPVVVYSNFLKNGIYTLAILLEKSNITYKTITGFTTNDKLDSIVKNYNHGMYQVLLISSAGSESLDLKNTRQIHIMEPHWNESKIDQVIGRAIRYQSHSNLPEDQRVVDIYRWISIFSRKIKNMSADQYLMSISLSKRRIWELYQSIIIDNSIEKGFD